MTVSITFLGGAGTVTGSKYLVRSDYHTLLVDCGLFQGYKQLRLRNWREFPIDPATIDAVLLTHAHIDHSGYIPRLRNLGFKGDVFCTPPTRALCDILLPDAGHLQESDADAANRGGYTRHKPARALYTERDAELSLKLFRTTGFRERLKLGEACTAQYYPAGHILGAASIQLMIEDKTIVFSGDLGRYDDPIMADPETPSEADYLLIESTYGDRKHASNDPASELETIVNRTLLRGGALIIPSFAVGRAQMLLYYFWRLLSEQRIPDVPIFLDSPMAIDASDIFEAFIDAHKLNAAQARAVCATATYTRLANESKRLDADRSPKIIISASGMATGGRILHHLKAYSGDPKCTILFAGFQAGGTRGAAMLRGVERIKIHGEYWPVRAEVQSLSMLSAHADSDELMVWLNGLTSAPKETFVIHGEADAADQFRHRIQETYGWSCRVPDFGETVVLS